MIKSFPLLGVWKGSGTVLPEFRYEEELNLSLFGTPVAQQILFSSKTWKAGSSYEESPLHTELGMMKIGFLDSGVVLAELLVSHPFGMTEIENGEFRDGVLEMRTWNIARSPTAAHAVVEGVRRKFWVEGERLKYELYLKVLEKDEYLHLQAELQRVDN
jgi:hypothetical protein